MIVHLSQFNLLGYNLLFGHTVVLNFGSITLVESGLGDFRGVKDQAKFSSQPQGPLGWFLLVKIPL